MNAENPFHSTDPETVGDDNKVHYMFGVPVSREDLDTLEAELAQVEEAEQPAVPESGDNEGPEGVLCW